MERKKAVEELKCRKERITSPKSKVLMDNIYQKLKIKEKCKNKY